MVEALEAAARAATRSAIRQSPSNRLLSSQMSGVRPATAARNAARVGGGSPDPLIRTSAISALPMAQSEPDRSISRSSV
jgi:hypothetical protein